MIGTGLSKRILVLALACNILAWNILAGSTAFSNDDSKDDSPNIVFILIDDLRYDTFGFASHSFIETPFLDELASDGMVFKNAFVTSSLCSPSRASFLSGQYMHHHRVVDNNDLMDSSVVTFPQRLQEAGYETAFIGKWHMGGSSDAAREGFDHWVSFRGQGTYAPANQTINVNGTQQPRRKYMTDELTDYASDWLAGQSKDQPFLLYLSHKGVHGLYDPADRHRDRYKDVEWLGPVSMDDSEVRRANKPMWVADQRNSWHGIEFPYHGRAKQSMSEMYRHYCEMILSVDESVGRIREQLKEQQLDQNTVIIFTSDGGHLWGEHGLIDKRCAYEPSIRIPMLVAYPPLIAAESTCEGLVSNIDVAPTLLELAGVEVHDEIDGQSFTSLLSAPDDLSDWRSDLLYEYYWEPNFPQTPTTFCLRESRYKLIQYHGIWDTDELYDLENDPDELTNLIHHPDHQARVQAMRRRLYERLEATGGLAIPLGFKRNHGASLRSRDGSKRAEFPPSMIRD